MRVLLVSLICEVVWLLLCLSCLGGCLCLFVCSLYACSVCEALYVVAWCVVCDGVRGVCSG